MLSISQRLSQQQKLSPQQIQYQKLLQLNNLALEQRLKTELELNPILEEDLDQIVDEVERDEYEGDESDEGEDTYSEDSEFGLEDYMNDEDYFREDYYLNNNPNDEKTLQPIAPSEETLSDHLLNQLYMLDIEENLTILGEEIIGNLDQDGYLNQPLDTIIKDLAMFQNIEITLSDAETLLKRIQTFDPVGVAARDLRECLLIQLQNSSFDPYYTFLAEEMLKNHYNDFVHKRFEILMSRMEMTEYTFRTVLDIIQKLNPKPGEGNILLSSLNQITPDFLVEKEGNNYIVTLNDRTMPSVTISKSYIEMMDQNKGNKKLNNREKQTYKFLREKFESAKWFINCIQQRRETLLKVMKAIVTKQHEFFDNGTKFLKPMIYKDIADEIMMDISTISRVVNGKYVQSPVGIHELKYFFSEGLSTDSGREVSNKHIKELIKELCDGESKNDPYSDDKIAEILNSKGIHIARRTVAKYREQMMIPVARLRKEI